ncbi:MAG: UDP-N-acetylmuramoyl-L-alanine--D-glutamate ligase [Clostridiaceae bacterium]|jgi:UDP-N-acetylmuramoylalanine--D-glutamate ligase|nr:UDP-N-acetylmuramoyl-L-alanine--D-glutamate ligase [Clostridiaceae bacterium]
MNRALETYREEIRGKRTAVLGFGISNRPLARTLAQWGAEVTVFDKKEEQAFSGLVDEFKELGIEFSLGADYLDRLSGFDIIFRTPGMRFDLPQIQRETSNGAELTSEMETFMKLCPAFIYAVTGSDGKTTTTTLIYEMLKQEGYHCYLGGNIGTPLLDRVHEMNADDRVVLELSSFQLHTMKHSPDVAVITNISPNHLDIHKSMEEYISAKTNIFKYQNESNRIVLNYDNPRTKSFIPLVKASLLLFSSREECTCGAFIRSNRIVLRKQEIEEEIIPIHEIRLPGMHNVENLMAAMLAVTPDVSTDTVRFVARTFAGVEHRSEFVRNFKGISFYNDSIGSSPTRTIASIKAFAGNVVLIAGGYDKNLCYDELAPVIHERVKALVLLGATADKIEQAYRIFVEKSCFKPIPIVRATSMQEAVERAYNLAHAGDIVLLSPASASFDMYPNFQERGNHFKQIVNGIS